MAVLAVWENPDREWRVEVVQERGHIFYRVNRYGGRWEECGTPERVETILRRDGGIGLADLTEV